MRLVRISQVIGLQDALDAVGGGGGSETFDEVLANGSTLTADRVIDINGNTLTLSDGVTNLAVVKKDEITLNAQGLESASGGFSASATDGGGKFFVVYANTQDGTTSVSIFGDADGNGISYTAGKHTFTGRLNIQDVPEYADLAAAIADGLVDWDVWRIGADLKIVVPGI